MASVRKRAGYGFEVRYVDPATGKRHSKSCKLKKDADAFMRKVEREIEDGMHIAPANALTVEAIVTEYLKSRQPRVLDGRLGPERLHDLTSRMHKHFVRTIGSILWRDLTAARVEKLYADMIGGGGLSPQYARANISTLRMAERYANKHGYARNRPVHDAMADLGGTSKPRIKAMTVENAALVLRECLKHKPKGVYRSEARVAIFVHLAACCGMRVGEIMALGVDDIDLTTGALTVRHNLTRLNRLKATKTTAGGRVLALPDHLRAMLTLWVERFYAENPEGLLFAGAQSGRSRGNRFVYSDFHKSWRRLLTSCGLDEGGAFHFHALRHFAGSWWLKNGMLIPDVAKLLGHTDPAFTMKTYIHSLSDNDTRTTALKADAARLVALPSPANDASVTHGGLSA